MSDPVPSQNSVATPLGTCPWPSQGELHPSPTMAFKIVILKNPTENMVLVVTFHAIMILIVAPLEAFLVLCNIF